MIKELNATKACDWSLHLEDEYYAGHRDELMSEAVKAVAQTGVGYYFNLVTPAECGDPRQWFVPELAEQLARFGIACESLTYVDECGCGGFVSRVYR